jgi:aminopeptidase N
MKAYQSLSVALLSAFVLIGCTHAAVETSAPNKSAPTDSLSQIEAEARARMISDVDYRLHFELSDSQADFQGKVDITFTVLSAGRDLRLDFADGTVSRVLLDDQPIEPHYTGKYLTIPGNALKSGRRHLTVEFKRPYANDGHGLSRFVDPLDKNVYLHSQFEPFAANRMFPCFDQPDLKATYTLTVNAPKSWEVISSTRESSIAEHGANRLWQFPTSARFSTYIFSLHAGPFTKWEDKGFRIPLRLFARKSLAKFVVTKEWFPITRHGFDFFDEYFGYPYPYKKYDQIIVPEFGAGAMENVAAVTFSERFVHRGVKTTSQIRGLSNTIMHEMAHMWFGDLVTMKWWGDLWLNESFASYMASAAMAASPQFKDSAWQDFFGMKAWAYFEDQMSTTHPISGPVPSTDVALTTFDGITYGKGASVLKQLAYTIGEENFRKGLKNYFSKFAEKNTDVGDFFGSMSEASNRDLLAWRRSWLETAGLNSIAVRIECNKGKISQFVVTQSAPSGEVIMRPHAFEIGLLKRNAGQTELISRLKVEVKEPTTYVAQAIGQVCPQIVAPNLGDHGYFKVQLDDQTVSTLKMSITELTDPLLRQQMWHALWDKVRDAELSFLAFSDLLVPEAIAKEQDDLILKQILRSATSILAYYQYSPKLNKQEFPAFSERLDKAIWQRLTLAKGGSNDQLLWLDAAADLTSSPWGNAKLKRLLRGQESLKGSKVDQDRRWDFLNTLARNKDAESLSLSTAELQRDKSSRAVEKHASIMAAQPKLTDKMVWINDYKSTQPKNSHAILRTAFDGMFPVTQNDLREQFAGQFFNDLLWANQNREAYVASIFTLLAPSDCTPGRKGRLSRFITEHNELQPMLAKHLKMISQESERCGRIVGLAESGGRFSTP